MSCISEGDSEDFTRESYVGSKDLQILARVSCLLNIIEYTTEFYMRDDDTEEFCIPSQIEFRHVLSADRIVTNSNSQKQIINQVRFNGFEIF